MIIAALTFALAAQAGAPSAAQALPPALVKAAAPLTDAPATPPSDPPLPVEEKVSCRYVAPEGTMIGSFKECHTAKVWSRMAHAQ